MFVTTGTFCTEDSFSESVLRTLLAVYPKCSSCEELGVSAASV